MKEVKNKDEPPSFLSGGRRGFPDLRKVLEKRKIHFILFATVVVLFVWNAMRGSEEKAAVFTRQDSADQVNYYDCRNRSLKKLKEKYNRDGIVLFTPCSLQEEESRRNLISNVKGIMDEKCGNQKVGNPCKNRIVKSDDQGILDLAKDEEILSVISALHGRAAFPFQTLNFKWGTSQPFHSDLIHFAGFPSMTLTAAWVALEDIHPDAGPLEYFKGSHKEEFLTMEDHGCPIGDYNCYEEGMRKYISKKRMTPSSVVAKKGDVIIWASNAIHGGSAVKDESRTRYSQVTHYFLEGDDFYIQPKLSVFKNKALEKFSPRLDVPFKAVAKNMIDEHWDPSSKDYTSHYTTFHNTNFYDLNGADTGEVISQISNY